MFSAIADPDNLRLAFWKARKGKNHSRQVLQYRSDLEKNLNALREEILGGTVEVGQYTFFKIFDPKERNICAAAFREQVLHHALMNVCHPYFERVQIFDSYASRKGKGTYAALDRAKEFTRRYRYFLKIDVRKFFESIHHNVLKTQLGRLFKDEAVLKTLFGIIDSYQAKPDRGVPIGNLTSQYFANHYLSALDHFIKEQLRIKAYVRYMDDMVLWHDDKDVLKRARGAIQTYLQQEMKLELKPPLLNSCARGVPFLGYVVLPFNIRLSLRSRRRFVKKLRGLEENYHTGKWSEAACQRKILPLLAFTRHANTLAFRKSLETKRKY